MNRILKRGTVCGMVNTFAIKCNVRTFSQTHTTAAPTNLSSACSGECLTVDAVYSGEQVWFVFVVDCTGLAKFNVVTTILNVGHSICIEDSANTACTRLAICP